MRTVMRNVFSVLVILCVSGLQLNSAQVQSSQGGQKRFREIPVSYWPPEPDASSTVTTRGIQKSSREAVNSTEVDIEVSLNTTKAIGEIKERKSEKLSNHKKHDGKSDLDIQEDARKKYDNRKQSARNKKSHKQRNHHEKTDREGRENISRKRSKKRRQSAKKRKSEQKRESQKLRTRYEFLKSLENKEHTLGRKKAGKLINRSVERWFKPKKRIHVGKDPRSENYHYISKEWKNIINKKNRNDLTLRKHNSDDNTAKTPTTPPWPKEKFKQNQLNLRARTPIYMMQQAKSKLHIQKLTENNNKAKINKESTKARKERNADEKKRKNDDEDPVPEVLNIFSLREDMIRILKSISHVNASVEVIGRTAEYNNIVICKICEDGSTKKQKSKRIKIRADDDKYQEEDAEKKIIFIVHGLSAMGFNQVPCLYQEKAFIKLLKLYMEHLNKFDIFLIPIANPDGINKNVQSSSMNKNRSPQTACSGVALDRNFDVSWSGVPVNSCHQQYPGPDPFSEPESRAVGDILHQYNQKIAAYINVHGGSYTAEVFKGDAVLYPKGYVEFNSDDDKYMDMKGEIDESMRNAGFKVMSVSVDSLFNWYGKVTGTSVDYASSVYGIPYAMEFVMQPYVDDPAAKCSAERTSDNILTEVWRKVIDVVFTNIYRNSQNNDLAK